MSLSFTCFTVLDQHSMEKKRDDSSYQTYWAMHMFVTFQMQIRTLTARNSLQCRKCYCDTENTWLGMSVHTFSAIRKKCLACVRSTFSAVPKYDNFIVALSDALTGDQRFVQTVALVKLF